MRYAPASSGRLDLVERQAHSSFYLSILDFQIESLQLWTRRHLNFGVIL